VSLKRRLVAGTLVLLVAGVLTTDLVTASSLRSFLYGRLDEQIDAAQDTAYSYINDTYQRALAADVRVADHQPAGLAGRVGRAPGRGHALGARGGAGNGGTPSPRLSHRARLRPPRHRRQRRRHRPRVRTGSA